MLPQGQSESTAHATYATAHGIYRRAGWTGPLPLPAGRKGPPPEGFTGWHGTYPSGADSQSWIDDAPLPGFPDYRGTRQLGLHLADGVIGIDVDVYGAKRGDLTIAEAERRWGPLPPAPRSSARGADNPGGIRFYRVPPGTALRGKLGFPELNIGGIEIIQRSHRYAVVWPSTNEHAEHAPYLWYGTTGPETPPQVANLKMLPPAWIEALASSGAPGETAADPETVAKFQRDHAGEDGSASIRGPIAAFLRKIGGGMSRHEAMMECVCWAAREARAGCYSAEQARGQLRQAFIAALAEAQAGQRLSAPAAARREFESMWAWAVSQALAEPIESIRARIKPRRLVAVPESLGVLSAADAFFADLPYSTPAVAQNEAQEGVQPQQEAREVGKLNLPPEFWDARPSLKHIRDAALSRWACPDAVFGCVLARAGAFANPGDVADLGVGRSPLSVFVIPYGDPSAGKGLAVQVARDLLPVPAHLAETFEDLPLGSGEGITESYIGETKVTDPDTGRVSKVRSQVRANVLITVDEGEALVKLATRAGSTIATTIRRAWSGELLGENNGSPERRRKVERGAYSIGLIVSFQPSAVGPLFDPAEVGGGTPHRFLYLAADDDTLPEEPPTDLPRWPGALEVADRRDPELARQWTSPPARTFRLTDPAALDEIRRARWDGLRRASLATELDGHRNQYRGRVAAHLAALDGRVEIDGEDWRLAGLVFDVSDRVRGEAIAYGQRQLAAEARRKDERTVRVEAASEQARLAVADQHADRHLAKVAAILARKVLRDASPEGTTARVVRDAAARHRRDIGAALEYAVGAEWLIAIPTKQGGARYRIGPRIGDVPES